MASTLEQEEALGLRSPAVFAGFGERVQQLGEDLRDLLSELRAEGKRIAAYGAAAKGSVLLNTFGIGSDTVEFVADRNPSKQGRSMPGVHIPITAPSALLDRMPDVVLLLAWNLADEVLEQQAQYRARGGRFLIPIPEPVFT